MCGIAGIWADSGDHNELRYEIKNISAKQKHRGPDYSGFWEDKDNLFFLSHQRLSILDLSPAGNQPMVSHSGRYVIAYNGEIYNFQDLKISLEKKYGQINWKGNSDTEVLLALIDKYGLRETLNKCVGMFAIALWDKKDKRLYLARDRMGEKPIYYGFTGPKSKRAFIFSSEISTIRDFKYFNNPFNSNGLIELINYQAISAPNSIFEDIYQLLPGHILILESPKLKFLKNSTEWWSLINVIEDSLANPINEANYAEFEVEKILKESVRIQSISDVPLGTFLSGGIDSSLITALLQKQNINKVKTFTIGFEEMEFNEAPFSRQIANILGTDHTEILLTSNDALKLIPNLSKIYSEPFADSSQLPTHLVCREAKKNGLTVALTGDGGDESFGGYNRYFLGNKIWKKIRNIPWPIRKNLGEIGVRIPEKFLYLLFRSIEINQMPSKIYKLSERLRYVNSDDEFYFSLIAQWKDPKFLFKNEFLKDIQTSPRLLNTKIPSSFKNDLVSKMMIYDSLNYLPNDILTKVDRAAMHTSLETRAPFLDHRVVEIAWRLNKNFKISNNNTDFSSKWILRKILYKYVPKELMERPKSGFGIPLSKWMRGPLKSWISDLISKEMINKSNILNSNEVSNLWEEHLSEKFDHSSKLWPVIMWQSWLDNY